MNTDTDPSSTHTPPPAAVAPPPGFLRYLPPLLRDFWARGVQLSLDGASGDVLVEGFHTNGPMRLVVEDDVHGAGGIRVVAVDRRKRRTPIAAFDDLVDLNFAWWKISLGAKREQYVAPGRPWLDAFSDRHLVRRVVHFLPKDADGEGGEPEA